MDFQLSEEHLDLQRTVRAFARHEIAPHVRAWDADQTWPGDVIAALGRLGVMGLLIPPELGGSGLGYIAYVLALCELARVDASIALIVAAHTSLCANHVFLFGTPEQKSKFLPRLARAEAIGCWSLTEPQAGSDAAGTRTTAVRTENGWRLNGAKTFTTNGAHADLCVAMAVTDLTQSGGRAGVPGVPGPAERQAGGVAKPRQAPRQSMAKRGISAFIIERGTPGFRAGKKEDKLGMRASDTSEMIFEDCLVPADNLLGEPGHGFLDALQVLDGGRISIAALAWGLAQGALDAARAYARERRQFGRPIAEFQAIRFKLADMATEIEAARLLTLQAASLKDQGRAITRAAAMAKLFAGEVAVRAAGECVQIYGGYGFIKDYPAEKFYRDCKLCTIGEGTSEIQRLVIARELLQD